MRTVSLPEFKAAMAEVVAEVPVGQTYFGLYNLSPITSRCRYVIQDKPACIVARILAKLGVALEVLLQLDYGDFTFSGGARTLAAAGWYIDADVFTYGRKVQWYQDYNFPWSDIASMVES